MKCTFKLGAGTRCGGSVSFSTDSLGRLVEHCPRCARRRAGLCADCPRPVDGAIGKALRCAICKKRALKRNHQRWYARDPEHARDVRRVAHKNYRDRRRGGPPTPKEERYQRLGHLRAAALTPERRSEIARTAINARWARVKERAA